MGAPVPAPPPSLTLAEELLLLALDDTHGTLVSQSVGRLPYALAGAMLMDLALCGAVGIIGQEATVVPYPGVPVPHTVLREMHLAILTAPAPRTVPQWVEGRAASARTDATRIIAGMVQQGILTEKTDGATHRYPLRDRRTEQHIRERIRAIVHTRQQPDWRCAILIGLVVNCELLDTVFAAHAQTERAHMQMLARQTALTQVIEAMDAPPPPPARHNRRNAQNIAAISAVSAASAAFVASNPDHTKYIAGNAVGNVVHFVADVATDTAAEAVVEVVVDAGANVAGAIIGGIFSALFDH